jgi:solute carrier family 13 (sodium-dependent dicarboxylate transporter), member 2/3/5
MTIRAHRPTILLLVALGLGIAAALLTGALTPSQRLMTGIFVAVVVCWITEPVPIYVTGILASLLCALLLGPLAPPFGAESLDYTSFLSPFASPVVVLMFGGFVMARVFSANNLDLEFCRFSLSRFGSKPGRVLFGMMTLTAVMSMWMSNTATTAIMIATILPIVRVLPKGSNLSRAFLLGIPFAANIGGLGTPIGTPPNAIAIGLLAEHGVSISFLGWMAGAVPMVVVMLLVTYALIRLAFPLREEFLSFETKTGARTANRGLVYGTFMVTVALWLTDIFHHVPSALVALVPVCVFAVSGLFDKEMLRSLSWDILLLIGGGLALGAGIRQTGLGVRVIDGLALESLGPTGTLLVLGGAMALLATFISHTAAANIVLPLAMLAPSMSPVMVVVCTTLCASFGMALPISTPPNAIAYGSEMIEERDMAKVGAVVTVVGVLLTVFYEKILFQLVPTLITGAGA